MRDEVEKFFLILGIVFLLGIVSADVISINSGGSNNIVINPDTYIEGFFSQTNNEPILEEVFLYSENGRNETNADLICEFNVTDEDGGFLDAYVKWIRNSTEMFELEYNSIENGTLYGAILDKGNLSLGDVWVCSVRLYDGYDYTPWIDSNNVTIIDITPPNITIISPESINYSTVEIPFNISTNEEVVECLYDLDFVGNLTMNMTNSTYFWVNDSTIGPGFHEVYFYCVDPSGNWGMNYTNFTVDNEAAIAISLSEDLLWGVRWEVVQLPINDLDAVGNNLDGPTDYYLNISATNTLVDLYVRADGDLTNGFGDFIGLGNETFAVSSVDRNVTFASLYVMSTEYQRVAQDLSSGELYFKFYLDAPASQAAGNYLNNLDFRAVRNGQSLD